jgi:hypothetical protein
MVHLKLVRELQPRELPVALEFVELALPAPLMPFMEGEGKSSA